MKAMNQIHMIAYISDFKGEERDIDSVIAEIVQVAKIENQKRRITGALFFLDGQFLQVIEGKEADLRQLMFNIENDNRHHNIECLIDTAVQQRGFQQWNMDSFHLNSGQKFSREVIKDLTASFKKNLLPKSDMLVLYYKALLKQRVV
tara:strand:- start:43894 stop:44334 length:441 start_codon:yes stop_codon:yes gene_type:complete